MSLLAFLKDDQGVVSTEYVVFVGAIFIFLTVAVLALMQGLVSYFTSWKTFFEGAGS